MSQLLITKEDIRKAVIQYYNDYQPELARKFDFDRIQTYIGGERSNMTTVEFTVEEKE